MKSTFSSHRDGLVPKIALHPGFDMLTCHVKSLMGRRGRRCKGKGQNSVTQPRPGKRGKSFSWTVSIFSDGPE